MGLFDMNSYPGAIGGDFGNAPLSEQERLKRALEQRRLTEQQTEMRPSTTEGWQGQPTWPQQTQYAPAGNDLGAQAQGQYNQQVLKIQKQLLDDAGFEKMMRKERSKTNSIGMFAAAMSGRSFTPQSVSGPSTRGATPSKPDVDVGDIEKDLAWDEWMQNPGSTMDDLVLFAQKKSLSPDVFKFMQERMAAFDKGDPIDFYKYDKDSGKLLIENRVNSPEATEFAEQNGWFSGKNGEQSAKDSVIRQHMAALVPELETLNSIDNSSVEKWLLNNPQWLGPLKIEALNKITSVMNMKVHVRAFQSPEGHIKVAEGKTADAYIANGWKEITTEEAAIRTNKRDKGAELSDVITMFENDPSIASSINNGNREDAAIKVAQRLSEYVGKKEKSGLFSFLSADDAAEVLAGIGGGFYAQQEMDSLQTKVTNLINQRIGATGVPNEKWIEDKNQAINDAYSQHGKEYGDSVVALFKDAEGETTFTKRTMYIPLNNGTAAAVTGEQEWYTLPNGTRHPVGEPVPELRPDSQYERTQILEQGPNGEWKPVPATDADGNKQSQYKTTFSNNVFKDDVNEVHNRFSKKIIAPLGLKDIDRMYQDVFRVVENTTANNLDPGQTDDQLITMLIKMRDPSMVTVAEHELQQSLSSLQEKLRVMIKGFTSGDILGGAQRERMVQVAFEIYSVVWESQNREYQRLREMETRKYGEKGGMMPVSTGYSGKEGAIDFFFSKAGIDVDLFKKLKSGNDVVNENSRYFEKTIVTPDATAEGGLSGRLFPRDLNPTKPLTKKQKDDEEKAALGAKF
jgi:hypothetical protein